MNRRPLVWIIGGVLLIGATGALTGAATLIAAIASTTGHAAENGPALKQITSIDLPGPPGRRFDYLVIDYDDGWLFAAHLAANQTYVIDLRSNTVRDTVIDTPGAEGLEYVPDERKVYTSNASDNTVGVIDLRCERQAGLREPARPRRVGRH